MPHLPDRYRKLSAGRRVKSLLRAGLAGAVRPNIDHRRTAHAMLGAGFTMHDVDQVMWRNPVAFYDQSGRLDLPAEPPRADSCPQGARPDTYLGNSVRRGD